MVVYRSIVDIQSVAAEIRGGKKRKKIDRLDGWMDGWMDG